MKCNFCPDTCETLIDSHIIPKFIFKWIKKSSSTGRLRSAQNINRPVQDGLKLEFLCDKCEQEFSIYEKYFADSLFYPIANSEINFDELCLDSTKIRKFIITLIWRVAKFSLNDEKVNQNWTPEEIKMYNTYIEELIPAFKGSGLTRFNTFIVPTNKEMVENNVFDIEDYAYFERSASMDFKIYDDAGGRASLFIKIPFMLIVCELTSYKDDKWKGLNINEELNFDFKTCKVPEYIKYYLKENCEQSYSIASQMSSKQIDKIKVLYKKKAKDTDGTVSALRRNFERDQKNEK